MTRVGAKRGRLYNKAFAELGYVRPSKKAKASAKQKEAYRKVLREFKRTYKSGNAARHWYKCSVKMKYLPTAAGRKDIRKRFKELERVSNDKDIKNFKRKYKT